METVAVRSAASWSRTLRRVDFAAIRTWVLAGGLVLYLGIDGGGYDLIVRNQVGVILWWIALVAAAWGVLPAARFTTRGKLAVILFGAFVVWTALGMTWSISSERSLQELSRVSTYLAVLLLAVSIHRDRSRALPQTVSAVAAAIVVIALLATISRLFPGSFPASHVTGSFLHGARARLSWPLNYWNGLAALLAVGMPLLLSIASSARRLLFQAAAAAALPLLAMCGYLTFSRGGAISAAVALVAYLALAPNRIPKLATALVAAAGGAILIAGVIHRSAVGDGLTGHAAIVQGHQLFIGLLLVCAGVAMAQVGIGLATRHGTLPRILRVSPRVALAATVAGVLLVIVVGLAAHGPAHLSHAWSNFKHSHTSQVVTASRFGSTAGNDRYALWKVAVNSTSGHLVRGSGSGTYQLLWQPRAPFFSYVINAHSLYLETLSELGIVGLALLLGFFGVALYAGVRAVMRSRYESRTYAAGATAAMLAFLVSAIADWEWQLPVLPAAFLLLAGAVLAPGRRRRVRGTRLTEAADSEGTPRDRPARRRYRPPILLRVGLVATALACLAALGIPTATVTAVRNSQKAALAGDNRLALKDARSATKIDPSAASAQLQLALVLETQRDLPAAIQAATKASQDEPQNWSPLLILSRLEAESGHAKASVAAYERARLLNPTSPVFHQ
jgi:O-antigen ligase